MAKVKKRKALAAAGIGAPSGSAGQQQQKRGKKRKARAPAAEEQESPKAVEPESQDEAPVAVEAQVASLKKKKKKKKAGAASALDAAGEAAAEVAATEQASSSAAAAAAAAAGAGGAPVTLETWLRSGGAQLDAVEIRSCGEAQGSGAFARRDIAAGEVAFSIPTALMLTSKLAREHPVVARVEELLRTWKMAELPVLSLCLRLCIARARGSDELHSYAASLPESAPGAAAWPAVFRDFLAGTSLAQSIVAADEELNNWEAILAKVTKSEPRLLEPRDAFTRAQLEWARGMLQSRQFPGSFAGVPGDTSLCMVPFLDILNHKNTADISVKVSAGLLQFVCDQPVKRGEQIWNNYGDKSNSELLMCYGFALEDNKADMVQLPLKASDASGSDPAADFLKLSRKGLPEDIIDSIEEEQDTEKFIALLKACLLRRRTAKESLAKLPKALNFNVCKGPLNRARKRSIEAFLEGELQILETCLEEMQAVKQEGEEDGGEEAAASDGDAESGDEDDSDKEAFEEAMMRPRKRARRRR